jgi:glutamine cyclotransferase
MAGFVKALSGKLLFALTAMLAAVAIHSCRDLEDFGITPCYTCKVVAAYPHDNQAFTEGLAFEDGIMYEGTGLYEHSTLRKSILRSATKDEVDPATLAVLLIKEIPAEFFAEGITIYGDKIIQLTWQSGVGFVYKKDDFRLLRTFNYSTEGWGITNDGSRLIMSDGTATLYFLNPDTFESLGSIEVRDRGAAVSGLNELEYVRGEVYANVWPTERIARIDPRTGQVVGWINMKGLSNLLGESEEIDVLNGIAYDPVGDRLFVTGKFWPKLFQIELVALK